MEKAAYLQEMGPMLGMGIGLIGMIGFSGAGPSFSWLGLPWLIAWWLAGMFFVFVAHPIAQLVANTDYLIKAQINYYGESND